MSVIIKYKMNCSVCFFTNNSYWIRYEVIGMNKVIDFEVNSEVNSEENLTKDQCSFYKSRI